MPICAALYFEIPMIRSIVWDTLHNVNLQNEFFVVREEGEVCVKQAPTDDGEQRHTRRVF